MRMKAPSYAAGAAFLTLGLWMLSTNAGGAADDDYKAAQDAVGKVAELLAKKDEAGAKKEADAVRAKYELDAIMSVFKLRSKKGVGVGPTPKAISPDGIEALFQNMEKKGPPQKDAAHVERSAYISAAVAMIAMEKCPVQKKEKDKDPKEWKQWCEDMRKGSLDLAAALKAYKPADIKSTVKRLNESCINCHGPFRQ